MKQIKWWTVSLLIFAFQALSCTTVTTDKRPEGMVIERNKQTRPVWADAPTDHLLVNSTETRFHYAVLKQRDLPIAVKQSQIKAIESCYDLWKPGFDRRIDEIQNLKGLMSSPRTSKDMTSILDQVAHKIQSDIAQIEDIYYERVRIDNYSSVPELQGVTEYFDVHTLVQLLPVDDSKLRMALSSALQESKFPEMKKVGKDLIH